LATRQTPIHEAIAISLPIDMAEMVKSKVASGEYATESEVIRDGLRTLAARDAAVERWLRDEVAPLTTPIRQTPRVPSPLRRAWRKSGRGSPRAKAADK
jgi:putative addiction module CopG family antidote